MSTATPALNNDSEATSGLISKCRETCVEQTLAAFTTAGLASAEEVEKTRSRHADKIRLEEPADLIEILARMQGADEERMGIEASRIAQGVADVISPSPSLIPFAGKLIAPSSFYESYDQLRELARELRSPVIFAEDTDAIGTGALNPVAARIMADAILSVVHKRFGVRPFVSAVRLDYESWTFLIRKHFGT